MKTHLLPISLASLVPPGCFLGASWVLLDTPLACTTQVSMSSCQPRRHSSLLYNLLVQQDTSTCPTRRHALVFNKKTCVFLLRRPVCCWTGRHVVASCGARRPVRCFFSNGRHVLQEDISSCSTRRPLCLFGEQKCLLHRQDNVSLCLLRRHVLLLNKKTCLLVPQDDRCSC